MSHSSQHCLCGQVNLFIAVLKIKFAKAQTLFHSKLAKMSRKKRKNILGRALEKGQKSMRDQMKKRRDAGAVSAIPFCVVVACCLCSCRWISSYPAFPSSEPAISSIFSSPMLPCCVFLCRLELCNDGLEALHCAVKCQAELHHTVLTLRISCNTAGLQWRAAMPFIPYLMRFLLCTLTHVCREV